MGELGATVVAMGRNGRHGGLDLGSVTFVVVLVLRLVGVIGWPWVWVTAPLWASAALVVAVAVFVLRPSRNVRTPRRPSRRRLEF